MTTLPLPLLPGQEEISREADRLVLAEFIPPGVIVTDDLTIVQFRGRTDAFLKQVPGAATLELLQTAREELKLPLRRVLDQAQAGNVPARETGVSLLDGQRPRTVAIEVFPFSVHSERLFLVLFAAEPVHESLEPSELADILAGAAEGILVADAAGRILFANPSASTIFGYESGELIDLPIDMLVAAGLRELHAKHRAGYLAAPSPRAMRPGPDLVGRRKDGTEVAIEVTLNAVVRAGGPIAVAFVRDATAQRQVDDDVRAYQERLQRMSFEAVIAEERERRRIAIELHDRMGQALALAQIKLTSVRDDIHGEARSGVDGAVELLEQAIADARGLIFELSPPVLYDLGLKEALGWLAEDLEKRHGIKVEVSDDGADKRLDDAAKGVVFRAVRELLMNVLKHAQSPAAKVSLRRDDTHYLIDVEDEGIGFEVSSPKESPGRQGFGLLSVREQVTGLGGEVTISSTPGRGTLARVRVPMRPGSVPPGPGSDAAAEAWQP